MIHKLVLLIVISAQTSSAMAAIVTFEDRTLFTGNSGTDDGQPGGQYFNGDSGQGSNTNGWISGNTLFSNSYSTDFGGFWSGWAYSNVINSVSSGFTNQYASAAGGGSNAMGGVSAGENYAIGYQAGSYFNLPAGMAPASVDVTNSTYARNSMRDGDAFAKNFGGATGNDMDRFSVSFIGHDGLNASGSVIAAVEVALADFTFADNTQDFILSDWTNIDLTSLTGSRSVSLQFASTDVGQFGINTPTFVAIDNLSLVSVPEPGGLGTLCIITALAFARRRSNSNA